LAVNMQPNETRVFRGGETRSLTVSASGGTGTLVYSWTVTSNGINKGTLSAVTGQTVTWTAPASFPADQTWTIAATVTDELGKTATNANCQTTLTYTAARVCGSACGSDTDCPTGLGCVGGYCRNKSCSDRADCVCVTPPTVGCNSSCTSSANCQASLACVGGYCRNPSCTDRADCVCPVTPPAPPTPSPATHRECRDYACVTVSGAGADTCTSDASCRPAPTPPPIPPSGVALPTIVVLLGGAALALLGLLVL
jgi:hypothetical protein